MTIPDGYKPLSKLAEWKDNYNVGDVTAIARSIRRFGFNGSLRIWKKNVIAAGNHSSKALKLIQEQGQDAEFDGQWPPRNVVVIDGEWYVSTVDVSHLSKTEFHAFAIADNETVRRATRNEDLLAEYLQEIAAESAQMLLATTYTHEALDSLLQSLQTPATPNFDEDDLEVPTGGAKSDGSLLALSEITIAEPRHTVAPGDVWRLGDHLLICADVLTGWPTWLPYLKGENILFAPYPGPFVPLTLKAEVYRLVMVQPDVYIAGHILDRYTDIKGEGSVHKTH